MPVAGLRMTWPEAFTEIKGAVMADGVSYLDHGIYYAYWYYCAAAPDEARQLIAKGSQRLKSDFMFYTFSIGNDMGVSENVGLLNDQGFSIQAEDLVLLGELDNWKFYLCMAFNPDFADLVEPEYAEEYASLCGMKDEIAAAFTCYVPFNEYGDPSSRVIRITGEDLDGHPVSLEELCGGHAVSLVNVWATWCGPCISELPELQAIYTRNLENDCGVIGLMIDQDIEEARALISENGITYPIILVPKEFAMVFPYSAIPTTFYVNRGGLFLETKFTGAYPEMYEDVLLALRDLQ
ncbi:MAG: TlpA family protein disulfide reductase [Clostridia bacterium]|nr:TlpA family protein disulfide reductase [Clostridia bacterium]